MKLRSDWPVRVLDDTAKPDTQVEWWFVQGYYEEEGQEHCGRQEFMTAMFRYRLPYVTNGREHAFSLVTMVLDVATGRTSLMSQVDTATRDFVVAAGRYAPPAGFDPLLVRTIADEMDEWGPPRPIRGEARDVEVCHSPFRAAWDGFAAEHLCNDITLSFTEPGTGRACRFQLRPVHRRIHLSSIAVVGSEAMDYVSYPRLTLEGRRGERQVRGQAWMDHQWGTHGWLVAGVGQEQILGWDWLGIQLDNGRDLLVMAHRDQEKGTRLCQYAVLVEGKEPARLAREFELTPTKWWTSPATRARYPIEWHLEIPEWRVILDYSPLALDQELPMLAPLRAVWEGAGKVAGTWDGRRVHGRARLELHGYAYVRDFRAQLDGLVERLGRRMEEYLPRRMDESILERHAGSGHGRMDPAAQTTMLAKPLWDLLDRGGERWPPILGLLLLSAMGVPTEPYELLICLTGEMLVGGSQVLDDIEEGALVRRGAESLHARYGMDVAVNAGTAALVLPLGLLSDYPHLTDTQRLDLYRILSRIYVRTHLGQSQDLYWSRLLTVENLREWMSDSLGPRILEAYAQKTGTMVAGAAEGAAVIANADRETRQACADFGQAFGVAIQIIDDLVDFSPLRVAEGQGGADLAAGKLTYVIYHAMERLEPSSRQRLAEIFCTPALRQEPAARAEGIELVRQSGAMEALRQEASLMVEGHWAKLSAHLPPSEPKTMLRVFCRFIMGLGEHERDFDIAP